MKEPIYDFLRRRLAESNGLHNRIAIETGVSQSTVSRIHHGQCSPTLDVVQPLLDWFDQYDRQSSARVGVRAKRIGIRRAADRAAAAPIGE